MDSVTELSVIDANLVSSTRSVSGELGISYSSEFRHLRDFGIKVSGAAKLYLTYYQNIAKLLTLHSISLSLYSLLFLALSNNPLYCLNHFKNDNFLNLSDDGLIPDKESEKSKLHKKICKICFILTQLYYFTLKSIKLLFLKCISQIILFTY